MAFTFDQISTILNQIVQDATGRTATLAPRNTKEFVAVAETALAVGMDPIMGAINQMIGRTIFSVRPYSAGTRLIDMDNLTYGNAVRKITPIFADAAENQPMFNDQPANGQSTDQYTIKRPQALQTNFSGFSQWEVQAPTVFEDQLRSAFTGPDQLGEFMAAQMTAVSNELNSQKEALARNTIANFIGAKLNRGATGPNIKHVLTDYNTATGQTLTAEDIFKPANFEAFIKWFYSYVNDISDMMTKRSVLFHEGLTGYTIYRHTPKKLQRVFLYSLLLRQIQTMALSGIYHDNILAMENTVAPMEYWQSMTDRMKVSVDAAYTAADGTRATGVATQDNIIGLIFDHEAMGINVNLESVNTTPLNAKGRYYNTFYHFARRYFNDITENAVVFVLD